MLHINRVGGHSVGFGEMTKWGSKSEQISGTMYNVKFHVYVRNDDGM